MMFVIDPRPRYEYYTPYTASLSRDHYLGAALAQAEEARRAKEARARRQQEYRQLLQRQAFLDALPIQMPGALELDDTYESPLSSTATGQGYPWHAPTYFNWGPIDHNCGNPYFGQGNCPYAQNSAELHAREREDGFSMKETLEHKPSQSHRYRFTTTNPNPRTSTSCPISTPNKDLETKGKSKQVGANAPSPANELESASEFGTDSEVERATDPRALQKSISRIAEIETSFEKLENEFVFPDELDFEPSSLPELKLAYTSRNAPVRYYDHALQELLSELDTVASYGSARVREARRAIVNRVERALERLEEEIERKKEVATWKISKAANDVASLEEREGEEGDEVIEGGSLKMNDEMTSGPTESESAAAGDTDKAKEEKRDDGMEKGEPLTERHDELDIGDAPDTDMVEPATIPTHSTSAHETGTMMEPVSPDVETVAASVTTNGQVDAACTPDEVAITSSLRFIPTSPSVEVGRSSESHPIEDTEADAFLLSQSLSSSPPSPTTASSASTSSDVAEDALLVEMPDNELEQDEDAWVDVEA